MQKRQTEPRVELEGSRQNMFDLQAKERALAEGLVGSWLMPFSEQNETDGARG